MSADQQITVTAKTKSGIVVGSLTGAPLPSEAGYLGSATGGGESGWGVSTVPQSTVLAADDELQMLLAVTAEGDSFEPFHFHGDLSLSITDDDAVTEYLLVAAVADVTEPQTATPLSLYVYEDATPVGSDLSLVDDDHGVASAGGLTYVVQLTAIARTLPLL